MKAKPEIHIGIAFDSNYLRHFFALFTSIVCNNKGNRIVVHSIIKGVSKEEQKKINEYAKANEVSILYYEIDEDFVKRFIVTGYWSSAVYYRLFFPLIVPDTVERILYLDTDIIVVGNLEEVFASNIENYPVGAVYDNWVKNAPQLGIYEEGKYFNSGMMLINVPEWKRQKVSEKVFEYLTLYPERINYVDQDGLNAVLIDNWKKLDFKFNVLHSWIPEGMSKKEKEAFLEDKIIIHYTLDRPWKMLCRNSYRHLYHKYLQLSPFKPENKFVDYSLNKIPKFLKIRLVELYFDLPLVKNLWRRVKYFLAN